MTDCSAALQCDDSRPPLALGPFRGSGLSAVLEGFRAVFHETGFDALVGGRDVLDAGLRDLAVGALPIAAELTAAEHAGVPLAEAVFDPERWPHLARVHGFILNLMTMDVPGALRPWVDRIMKMQASPALDAARRAAVASAVQDPNPTARALSRFLVFEGLCLAQRITLLESGVQLEVLGGRQRDVEILAEIELRVFDGAPIYREHVLALVDPMRILEVVGLTRLHEHVEALKRELEGVSADVHALMERRRRVLEIADRLGPADRVVLINDAAEMFGEETLSARQLRRLNPWLLGDVSDAAIWKRRERLATKVGRIAQAPLTLVRPGRSLADLILQAMRAEEPGR